MNKVYSLNRINLIDLDAAREKAISSRIRHDYYEYRDGKKGM